MARKRAPGFEAQREDILAAAARLFAEQGFSATSMNQVAEACGVAKPTLYHYFQDKQDLLAQIREPISSWARKAVDTRGRILALIDPSGAMSVKLCRPAALDLIEALGEGIKLYLDEKQEVLEAPQVERVHQAYLAFNNALSLELGQAPTFFVTPKGVYDTDSLISNGSSVYADLK
ncbi:MAG: helix-turn-helix transcriptional regulator, partial [Proteobacteria bacterium]|nr:helix-turn-helix transcriptional regulator [Pseudomonadota bacterium]